MYVLFTYSPIFVSPELLIRVRDGFVGMVVNFVSVVELNQLCFEDVDESLLCVNATHV